LTDRGKDVMMRVEVMSMLGFITKLLAKFFGVGKAEVKANKLKTTHEPTTYSDAEVIRLLNLSGFTLDLKGGTLRAGNAYLEIDDKAGVLRIKDKEGNTLALKYGGKWYVHRLVLLKLRFEQA